MASRLVEVHIPASVEEIGRSAFCGCANLEKATFADGSQLREIGSDAFKGCWKLRSVALPNCAKVAENSF